MARFRKKILLREGEYSSPDGKLLANREAIQRWSEKFQDLKAKRFDIPVGWGHPDDLNNAKPIKRRGTRRILPKDNAGWLTNFTPLNDGGAEIEIEVPREEDASRVRANLAEVSPVIWDETEIGSGEVFDDFIGSVDLVLHPVDHEQSKFEETPAIACSLTRRIKDKPAVYRLAEESDMPDENEKGNDGNSDSMDGGRLSQVLDALAAMDVILAEDTNEENFLDRLESALLTAAAKDGNGENENGGAEDITVDESAAPEVAALSLERQYLSRKHREGVQVQLQALLENGQCTPAEFKAKKPLLEGVRLSLDKSGNHKLSGLEEWIESRKAVPKGTFFEADQRKRMSLEAETGPDWSNPDEVTEEEASAIARQILGSPRP